MKRETIAILGIGLLTCVMDASAQMPAGTNASPDYNKNFKNEREKISYAIGMNFGNAIRSKQFDVDMDAMERAMKASLAGEKMLITEAEEGEILSRDVRKYLGDRNKAAGDAFLAKNKTQPGVVPLPDGLQYRVITEGKGDSPKSTDTVTVNYRGKLINGFEFDTTYGKDGKPREFGLNGETIKGWSEALMMMKPGAKWEIFIPPSLAYGEAGRGPIGPNETLVFEAELISAAPAKQAKAPEPLTSDIVKVPSAEEMKNGTAQPKTLTPQEVEEEKAKAAVKKDK
jgi:FKBP-type peptidyl-prolyl cis-trans isomerase FklB